MLRHIRWLACTALFALSSLFLATFPLSNLGYAHPLDEDVILDIEQGQLNLNQEALDEELKQAERRKRIRTINAMSWWELSLYFISQGFSHIVPLGIDHLLFVIGLALLSSNWKSLLGQVSVFTIAHSITLMALVLGLIPKVSWAEILIALSIVYIGVESVMSTRLSNRLRLFAIFLFGLMHGVGFAGSLIDIGFSSESIWVSLLAFNLGVEFGQISVLLAYIVLFYKLNSTPSLARIAVPLQGGLIAVAGSVYLYLASAAYLTAA